MSSAADARPRVSVVALFPGKAMLHIDGRPTVLQVGERSREGVLLVSADARQATVEIDGHRSALALDGQIRGTFADRPESRTLKLAPGENGHYFVDGTINGNPVPFMVDTGASVVAINKHVARGIGLLYRTDGEQGAIETASGIVPAYYLKFDRVRIRSLELRNVDGVVVDGDYPKIALLGQSFLNRFNMQRDGVLLELIEK
ncbi:MAG: TIGR02281 family clan AA aspartic protease [Gammaproteobacteria bacterium]